MREAGGSGSGGSVLALTMVAEADALYHDQAEVARAGKLAWQELRLHLRKLAHALSFLMLS